jgi:hypothetical protein
MNIYLSGYVNHSNDRADIPVLKLNRNGKLLNEYYYNGRIADCGALQLQPEKSEVYLTGGCLDYNVSENSTFIVSLSKNLKEKYSLQAPDDVRFLSTATVGRITIIVGSKTVHPESTLQPFIMQMDSTESKWSYEDSSVWGLAHIIDVKTKGDSVYFLGDDTGNANGTIMVFKYTLNNVSPLNTKSKKRK